METLGTPKRRPPTWSYYYPFPTTANIELGFPRRRDGVHQGPSRGRPTRSCKTSPPPSDGYRRLTTYKISGIANGLEYLHSCDVVHGNMKGVRGHS